VRFVTLRRRAWHRVVTPPKYVRLADCIACARRSRFPELDARAPDGRVVALPVHPPIAL